MARIAWVAVEGITALAAAQSQELQFNTPRGETVEIHQLLLAAGADVDIEMLQTTDGQSYTNASVGSPIPGEFFANPGNDQNNIGMFNTPIIVNGNESLRVRVKNNSGSPSEVQLVIKGIKDTG